MKFEYFFCSVWHQQMKKALIGSRDTIMDALKQCYWLEMNKSIISSTAAMVFLINGLIKLLHIKK